MISYNLIKAIKEQIKENQSHIVNKTFDKKLLEQNNS